MANYTDLENEAIEELREIILPHATQYDKEVKEAQQKYLDKIKEENPRKIVQDSDLIQMIYSFEKEYTELLENEDISFLVKYIGLQDPSKQKYDQLHFNWNWFDNKFQFAYSNRLVNLELTDKLKDILDLMASAIPKDNPFYNEKKDILKDLIQSYHHDYYLAVEGKGDNLWLVLEMSKSMYQRDVVFNLVDCLNDPEFYKNIERIKKEQLRKGHLFPIIPDLKQNEIQLPKELRSIQNEVLYSIAVKLLNTN